MTDIEFAKAIDICEKLDFFGGCRAGRELWFGKPVDVQDRDIKQFVEDVAFLKDFIKRRNAEIVDEMEKKEMFAAVIARQDKERAVIVADRDNLLKENNRLENHFREVTKMIRAEAIREFAERLKEVDDYVSPLDIDYLVKEMTEGK